MFVIKEVGVSYCNGNVRRMNVGLKFILMMSLVQYVNIAVQDINQGVLQTLGTL